MSIVILMNPVNVIYLSTANLTYSSLVFILDTFKVRRRLKCGVFNRDSNKKQLIGQLLELHLDRVLAFISSTYNII